MKCRICGGQNIGVTYNGLIRNGGLGKYTEEPVTMWQCKDCGVIWHDLFFDNVEQYYESEEYRKSLEGSSEINCFYKLHDNETMEKLQYTGTDIFRGKIVADIGCGGGAFLDFVAGVSKSIVAIEPSEKYRYDMETRGYRTYAYIKDALNEGNNKINVITSFDVIEHVENPVQFMEDIYSMLSEEGRAIIGTPTDAPIMRCLLGQIYEKKLLFSTQHMWVFSEKSLEVIAKKVGFKKVRIKYFQRYGIGNMLGWLREKEPCSDIKEAFITPTLDAVWKSECSANRLSDYIVLYAYK